MDKIYTREMYPHISHKINLGEHFEEYKNHLSQSWMSENSAQVKQKESTLLKIGAMMADTDEETLTRLDKVCRIDYFCSPLEESGAELKGNAGQKDHPNAGKFLCSDSPTLSSVVEQETLKSHKKMYQRRIQDIKKSAIPKFPREPNPSCSRIPEDFVLIARVFKPFNGKPQSTYHTQDFLLRGSLDLGSFKNAITCENDSFKLMNKDGTEALVKNLVLSSMFFFGDTFYCDIPYMSCPDYSEQIRGWMKSHGEVAFGSVDSRSMTETRFTDLEIRFGFPYLFKHFSECEHNVVFLDARLMTPDDPQSLASYPLAVANPSPVRYCVCCDTFGAEYMTEDEKIPISPAVLCFKCCKQLYGVDRNGELNIPKGTIKMPLDFAYAPPDENGEGDADAGDSDDESNEN